MPQESIAAYVNNIIAFIIFVIVLALIFAFLFLLSHILNRRTGIRNNMGSVCIKKEFNPANYPDILNYKKDPYRQKNIFILGTVLVIIIVFIFLIFAVFNYSRNPSINLNLYLIIGIIFYLILMVIYLVRSKIIS